MSLHTHDKFSCITNEWSNLDLLENNKGNRFSTVLHNMSHISESERTTDQPFLGDQLSKHVLCTRGWKLSGFSTLFNMKQLITHATCVVLSFFSKLKSNSKQFLKNPALSPFTITSICLFRTTNFYFLFLHLSHVFFCCSTWTFFTRYGDMQTKRKMIK